MHKKCITTQVDSSLPDLFTISRSPSHIYLCHLKVTVLAPLQWGHQTLSNFGFLPIPIPPVCALPFLLYHLFTMKELVGEPPSRALGQELNIVRVLLNTLKAFLVMIISLHCKHPFYCLFSFKCAEILRSGQINFLIDSCYSLDAGVMLESSCTALILSISCFEPQGWLWILKTPS
jgi:hypothetical protein